MADKKLRAGLTGIGDFAPGFSKYICEVMDLVAIASRTAENRTNFVKKTGLEVAQFDNPEKMMDEMSLDAVVICTPNFVHERETLLAAERGIHVFCEKPMEINVPRCWNMVHACKEAGVRLMVGHKRRLRPPWARMIELRKELGPVCAIDACGYFDGRPYGFDQKWWAKRNKSGGLLHWAGVHVLDWIRGMCPDVATVRAVAAPQINSGYEFPDTIHTTLTFHSGAVATYAVSVSSPLWKDREASGPSVICKHGGMRMTPHMDHIDVFWQHEDDKEPRHERFDDLGFDHAFRKELADFAAWVTDGKQPCLTWEEGFRCVEIMEAAHRSVDEGGAVIELPLYPELEQSE